VSGIGRVVFMGTPDFAVNSLDALIRSRYEVAAVFTRPDKPRGRGNKIAFTPVKQLAVEHGIPVHQPITLKSPDSEQVYGALKALNPDVIAVAAYGLILPENVLALPKYGCVNVHASLLPKYRGAAPINRCIMNGETKSGVTIMQMDKGLDTGDMLLIEEVDIARETTATELERVLAELGSRLLITALDNIETLPRVKQNDSEASYASMIAKSDCEIDMSKPPEYIYNFIRGLADSPAAYTFINGKRVKVFGSVIVNDKIEFTEVQPEGGKRMSMEAFLRGNKGG